MLLLDPTLPAVRVLYGAHDGVGWQAGSAPFALLVPPVRSSPMMHAAQQQQTSCRKLAGLRKGKSLIRPSGANSNRSTELSICSLLDQPTTS
jgi:hypothetical protein